MIFTSKIKAVFEQYKSRRLKGELFRSSEFELSIEKAVGKCVCYSEIRAMAYRVAEKEKEYEELVRYLYPKDNLGGGSPGNPEFKIGPGMYEE